MAASMAVFIISATSTRLIAPRTAAISREVEQQGQHQGRHGGPT
jgi:hypothetical protein